MDTTTSPPRVLVIGLDPCRVPGPWDPEPASQAIEAGLTKFADTAWVWKPASSALPEATTSTWSSVMRCEPVPGSASPSAAACGAQTTKSNSSSWSSNLIRRHAPGAAIAFNSTPDTTYEAAARWIE
ncbi:hypothetical protein ABZ439_25735 [Streptomyces sp. NPDC005840]|uniref:hypothetical protein n=1 Tax=Streptomyces sp. NPDC005840 TaxID=3157072 RepID=UPI0033ECF626